MIKKGEKKWRLRGNRNEVKAREGMIEVNNTERRIKQKRQKRLREKLPVMP